MNYSLTSVFKLSSVILTTILLTACPSPGKMQKAFETQEKLEFQEKYETLFNESVNEQKSDLLFDYAIYYKSGATITLYLKDSLADNEWLEDLMHFQRKLRQTKTKYQVINIYDRGSLRQYVSRNLEMHDQASELFQKNLNQIRQGKIEELYETMGETSFEYETIKELMDYVKVTKFDDIKLIDYPSDEIFANDRTAFCLKVSSKISLYFSYISRESEGLVLRSIDMNNYSS